MSVEKKTHIFLGKNFLKMMKRILPRSHGHIDMKKEGFIFLLNDFSKAHGINLVIPSSTNISIGWIWTPKGIYLWDLDRQISNQPV